MVPLLDTKWYIHHWPSLGLVSPQGAVRSGLVEIMHDPVSGEEETKRTWPPSRT